MLFPPSVFHPKVAPHPVRIRRAPYPSTSLPFGSLDDALATATVSSTALGHQAVLIGPVSNEYLVRLVRSAAAAVADPDYNL